MRRLSRIFALAMVLVLCLGLYTTAYAADMDWEFLHDHELEQSEVISTASTYSFPVKTITAATLLSYTVPTNTDKADCNTGSCSYDDAGNMTCCDSADTASCSEEQREACDTAGGCISEVTADTGCGGCGGDVAPSYSSPYASLNFWENNPDYVFSYKYGYVPKDQV